MCLELIDYAVRQEFSCLCSLLGVLTNNDFNVDTAVKYLPGKHHTYQRSVMAEVLGIVGSVIGIAQLTGTIITTGAKISGILKDLEGIPDEISDRLEQLHMLSLSLQHSEGMGNTTNNATLLLMDNARQHCQACLFGLSRMLETLTDRLETARGAKRKVVLARHILRKDELAKIERRLSRSVELLTVVNQMYMMYAVSNHKFVLGSNQLRHVYRRLLETQRLDFVEHTPGSTAANMQPRTQQRLSPEATAIMSKSLNSTSSVGTVEFQPPFRQYDEGQETNSSWGLGFTYITGTLELEFYQSPPASNSSYTSRIQPPKDKKGRQPSSEVLKAKITVRLPTWWSSRVIEAFVYRSQCGWSQRLRTRNILAGSDQRYKTAMYNIAKGDLAALTKQFDQRQLTPWDENEFGWNLILVGVSRAQFTVIAKQVILASSVLLPMSYLFISYRLRS